MKSTKIQQVSMPYSGLRQPSVGARKIEVITFQCPIAGFVNKEEKQMEKAPESRASFNAL